MRKLIVAMIMVAACAPGARASQDMPAGAEGVRYIFFDWGEPELDSDARATLDEVATAYRRDPGARLRISGHTDRSGGAAINRRAARQRATRVSAYLATRGVPHRAMMVISHGEEQPIVPTEDGVREAQNRRVEISVN